MKKKKRRRSRLLPVLLVLALIWGNRSIVCEEFSFASPALPEAFDGFRLAVLTDLHSASFGEDNWRLLDAVAARRPDAILLVGDLVDERTEDAVGYAASLGAQLAAIAPTYYVTGNHEWAHGTERAEAVKTALRAAGVTVLTNEYRILTRGGDTIFLAGIDDPNAYADQKTPEALARELESAKDDPFWLLLAHRNDRFAAQYSRLGADLTLSGHGHGGCIRLPFTDGLLGTQHNFFPTHTAGFYCDNGAWLFVSRGLGNVGATFRVFNRPQAAFVTLKRG